MENKEQKDLDHAYIDFTTANYKRLLDIAKERFAFIKYPEAKDIDPNLCYVLWRHDIDVSPQRAHRLAQIEYNKGVVSTYFVWLHSPMYHFFDREIVKVLKSILDMGHDIGLHFDSGYYGFLNAQELVEKIQFEKSILEKALGRSVIVFSYHDPGTELPDYGKYDMGQLISMYPHYFEDSIGGLINTYSNYLWKNFTYCSDSNGYWRYDSLESQLNKKQNKYLQVLTHPEWWQESPMSPRQRIFRSVYGRAKVAMNNYDATLALYGRQNHSGPIEALRVLYTSQPDILRLCDYLWNEGYFRALFIQLWNMHKAYIIRLSNVVTRQQGQAPCEESNHSGESEEITIQTLSNHRETTDNEPVYLWRLFERLFEKSLGAVLNTNETEYKTWSAIYNELVHGQAHIPNSHLEKGCAYICRLIESIGKWGI